MLLRLASLSFALLLSLAAASAQTPIPSDSRLKSVVAKKTVRIAYRADARPFSSVIENEPAGYTIDLCKLVVKSIEQQFKLQNLKIEWVPVGVDTRFSAVANGKADMECGSSTVTLGRMKEVDFSVFVFAETTGVLVAHASNIHAFAEMSGKKIAVVSGTTNERVVAEQVRARQLDTILVSVKDRDEGIAALEAGKVDAFASDKLLLAGAQFKHPEALDMLPDDLSIEPYAIVLPRGDWAFRLAVNTGLAKIFRDGRTAQQIFEKWFFGARPGPLLGSVYALGRLPD
ncbi:MAG TPA: amino acid ABC transporter substrate-binding protein [Xanthobacteraceae bacterium]|jgi:ABC-type amino acid transport substrate-binding protein|nr:amino acid ABC transporter substrate-binding protein [Xanthobacteraceae bacterium]